MEINVSSRSLTQMRTCLQITQFSDGTFSYSLRDYERPLDSNSDTLRLESMESGRVVRIITLHCSDIRSADQRAPGLIEKVALYAAAVVLNYPVDGDWDKFKAEHLSKQARSTCADM